VDRVNMPFHQPPEGIRTAVAGKGGEVGVVFWHGVLSLCIPPLRGVTRQTFFSPCGGPILQNHQNPPQTAS
jgi:hypothetical protein